MADSIECLAHIFQDINMNSENLSSPELIYSSAFVVELINTLIGFVEPKHPACVRVPAFDCLTNLLVASPPELIAKLELLIKGMLQIVADPDARVRQRIYTFLLGVCQVRKDIFVSLSDQIFPVIAKCMKDSDFNAKRACFLIFWEFLTFYDDGEAAQVIQLLIPHFEEVIPALLANSVLAEEDKENIRSAAAAFVEVAPANARTTRSTRSPRARPRKRPAWTSRRPTRTSSTSPARTRCARSRSSASQRSSSSWAAGLSGTSRPPSTP